MKPSIEFGRTVALSAAAAIMALGGQGANAAQAALDAKGQASVLRDLSACPQITQDAARLACYDKAARALIQAETSGEVVVVDRQQAQEVRRQSFGFQIPSLNIFSRGESRGERSAKAAPEEDVNKATVEVATVGRTGEGKLMLTTVEGAVWVQTDGFPINAAPRKGDKITIVRAAVGGYFCDISRYQSVRCERRR